MITAAALAAACGGEPKLDVQVAGADTKAQPSQPAATHDAEATAAPTGAVNEPPMVASHAPTAATDSETLPAGHPPIDPATGMMSLAPVAPGTGTGSAQLLWKAPGDWVAVPPSSSMRRAQYRVPGPAGDAECAVFYFGPGQGGDPMANAERWASQFVDEQGQPALGTLKTRKIQVGPIDVLVVEARGTYQASAMMGGPAQPQPGYALLAAVAEGPDANWFFKMVGPEATVQAQQKPFQAMLESLKSGG